jgi:hypothetical protein
MTSRSRELVGNVVDTAGTCGIGSLGLCFYRLRLLVTSTGIAKGRGTSTSTQDLVTAFDWQGPTMMQRTAVTLDPTLPRFGSLWASLNPSAGDWGELVQSGLF